MPIADLRREQPGFSINYGRSGSTQRSSSRGGQRFAPDQQRRINRLYPQVEGRLSNTTIGTPQSYMDSLEDRFPQVDPGEVYSPQQIQEQSNLLRALGEQQAAGIGRQLRQQGGGRGLTSGSPLLAELQSRAFGRARSAATEAENDLRFQAAAANARQRLGADELGVRRSQAIGQIGAGLRQQDIGRENALLQALAFYNQPLSFRESDSFGRSFSNNFGFSQTPYKSGGRIF